MRDPAETVVHVTRNPSWLPDGARAEVIRRTTPPTPMCIVRLMIRRGDDVFCTPRSDGGKLDLPMKATGDDDPTGSNAIARLTRSVLGAEATAVFVGAVRNLVSADSTDYEWPTPRAHFGVWSADGEPVVAGTWMSLTDATSALRGRHWYPLVS